MFKNRRITEILPSLWYSLKQDKDLPHEIDIEPRDIEEISKDSFIVEAYFNNDKEPTSMDDISLSYTNYNSVLNPISGKIQSQLKETYDKKKPISYEGEFTTDDDRLVKYRQALVPFKAEDDKYIYVIGAVRWKIYKK